MKTKKFSLKFNFHKLLLMFALIPLVLSTIIISAYLVSNSKKEIKEVMHNYMYSLAVAKGEALAEEIKNRGQLFALGTENLTNFCGDITVTGVEGSYCYVADSSATMLWHPDEAKIGEPVTNSVVQGVCSGMAAGNTIAPSVVEYEYKGAIKYASYYVPADNSFVLVVSADEDEVMSDVKTITYKAIAVAAALIIIFIVVATILTKMVVKPLGEIVNAMKKTAEGDLNADTEIKATITETQELVESAKTLQNVLQKTIGDTQNISTNLKSGADTVFQLAEQSKDGSEQISHAIEDLAQGATTMAQSVQEINEQVVEIGEAIDGISSNTDKLVSLSNNIKSANNDASEYIGKVSGSSEKSVGAVQDITEQINATNKSVDKIKNAVEMISSIASQTNLLALNASIEAARAGEAGRGFAVVAEEIKNLSEQSNSSADDIKHVVNEIITQSEKSVKLAVQVAEIIEEEQGYIKETAQKFEILNNEIGLSLNEIQSISSQVNLLNASKDTITESVSDLSAISEENAASNEEVSASATQIAEAITDIANNSNSTNEMADNLTETVSYFK